MFRSSAAFAFTMLLENAWHDVLDEYRNIVADRMHAWPETQYYDGDWQTFGLYAFGHRQSPNCALCPRTTRLVEQIPGMVMAGFSRLAPGTHITPHQGYAGWAEYVLRCHLGLIVNDRCALRVGDETRMWQAGRTLVFCDAEEHEAWNRGDTERVVLLIDFRNPAFRWKVLNPDLTPEIERYIHDRWRDLSAREKLSYCVWRMTNLRRSQSSRRPA